MIWIMNCGSGLTIISLCRMIAIEIPNNTKIGAKQPQQNNRIRYLKPANATLAPRTTRLPPESLETLCLFADYFAQPRMRPLFSG